VKVYNTIGAIHLRAENEGDAKLLMKMRDREVVGVHVWKDHLMKHPAMILSVDPWFEEYKGKTTLFNSTESSAEPGVVRFPTESYREEMKEK